MYLSETEVYKRFYKAVTKVIDHPSSVIDEVYGEDVYSQTSHIAGMIALVEEMLKEEEK